MVSKCISGTHLPSTNQEIMINFTSYTHDLQRQELSAYNKNNNGMYTFNKVTMAQSTRSTEVKYDACYNLHNKAHSNSVAVIPSAFAVEDNSVAGTLSVFAVEDFMKLQTELRKDLNKLLFLLHCSFSASEIVRGEVIVIQHRVLDLFDVIATDICISSDIFYVF